METRSGDPLSVHDSAPRLYGLEDSVFEVALHEPASTASTLPEAVVQDLWATQQFDRRDLYTHDGQPLTVLDPGHANTDGGPDFRNAHLRIGAHEWHGDVEVHVASDGWTKHRHHEDARYDSVVLHVVLSTDASTGRLRRADGSALPELVLMPRLTASLRALLHRFYTQPVGEIACAARWGSVPAVIRNGWIGRLGRERMHAKKQQLADAYLRSPDLEELLHEQIMAGLGYAPNADAMRSLAGRIPLSLARSIRDPVDLEALHLGIAGLLPAPGELLQADRDTATYVMELRDRFARLNQRLGLAVMNRTSWQFFRLRPANFPPLRIAQAVALFRADLPGLLHRAPLDRIAAALTGHEPVATLRHVLAPPLPAFWAAHVRLDRAAKPHHPALGRQRADTLIVNALAPVMLLYAEQTGDPVLEETVFHILEQLPAEHDTISRKFEALGARPKQALAAQGLHQLYRTRCTEARCLVCDVGRFLLNDREDGASGHPARLGA